LLLVDIVDTIDIVILVVGINNIIRLLMDIFANSTEEPPVAIATTAAPWDPSSDPLIRGVFTSEDINRRSAKKNSRNSGYWGGGGSKAKKAPQMEVLSNTPYIYVALC
jgi:hypothetical protein